MIKIFNHPLINDKLAHLRDKHTNSKDFRQLINEIAILMSFEVTKDLNTTAVEIETPIQATTQHKLSDNVVIAPILRAGLGITDAFERVLPQSPVAILGMYRDEKTLEIHPYYEKYPQEIAGSTVILLDPMLATGASAIVGVEMLKRQNVKNIKFVGIVGVDTGIDNLHAKHPDVEIYLAAKDEKLNENSYIVPGLGDAGDRIFNTVKTHKKIA